MSDATTDWLGWHDPYADPDTPLSRRLRVVQGHIRSWLVSHPDRDLRVVSACAGQGRDLLEVLAADPDAARVSARLVELDPRNADAAERSARASRIENVEVVRGDAGRVGAYLGALPADLVLMCGVFGNVSDEDVRRTVSALPQLCSPEATVIWTRSRRAPDLTPQIRRWFAEAGFAEVTFDAPDDVLFSVGVHRFAGEPQPPQAALRLFEFATPSMPSMPSMPSTSASSAADRTGFFKRLLDKTRAPW